jgi:beta-lactamase regulating signal transducer with metallopeptidase domain
MQTLLYFSSLAAGSLVSSIWQGALIVACVAVCLRLMPGVRASARSLVWTVVFLMLVVLPFTAVFHAGAGNGTLGHVTRLSFDVRWAWALAGVWAVLGMVRLAQLVRSAVHLRGISKRAQGIEFPAELAEFKAGGNGIFGRRAVQLCTSDEVSVPSVVGFFKPLILLPPELLTSLSTADLRQILLHEMEHLRRGDDWTNLLQKVSLVLFPVNPVLLWVERRLCVERELACDDGVLRATGARKAYATCLANLAEQSLIRRGALLALGAWERQSELARRVTRILRTPSGEMGRVQTAAMVAVMLAGTTGGVMALAHAPQLVSFNNASAVATGEAAQSVALHAAVAPTLQMAEVPHAELVKAVMPWRRVAVRAVKTARVSPIPDAVDERQVRRGQSEEMLIGWKRDAAGGFRPVAVTFTQDSQFTYAAIPVQDGWLIVQL